jgi:16S rRNA (uracil1498-N3)-methyltransferase
LGDGPPPGGARRRGAAAQVFVEDPCHPEVSVDAAHHLDRVLRLRPGERVVASDGHGHWALCRYAGHGRLERDGPLEAEPAPSPLLGVAFSPAKRWRPEWVVEKLTELGVDRIVVVEAARSVVRWPAPRVPAILERLRRVAVEASAQSRRVWLPEVSGVCSPASLPGDGWAMAEPGGGRLSRDVTAIAVGPEGGWTDEEIGRGRPLVGLGDHVLRAETAAIAAGVLLADRRAGTVCGRGS